MFCNIQYQVSSLSCLYLTHFNPSSWDDTYKFHVQKRLAKYPESAETYAAYMRSIADDLGAQAAESTLARDLTVWKRRKELSQCSVICRKLMEGSAADSELFATALYHEAWARFRMNGAMEDCISACQNLTANCLDSKWRPEALRMLTNAYIAQGKHDDALGILEILKLQYGGTKWEHYADMRPAMVYEFGKGDPGKALQIYQESLARYPDHLFGQYINKQMKRLRAVLEQELILDALEDLAQADQDKCHRPSVVVRAKTPKQPELTANF